MDHDLEHCDSCWTELEASQIGLCDSCQGEEGVIVKDAGPSVNIIKAAFRDASFFPGQTPDFPRKHTSCWMVQIPPVGFEQCFVTKSQQWEFQSSSGASERVAVSTGRRRFRRTRSSIRQFTSTASAT